MSLPFISFNIQTFLKTSESNLSLPEKCSIVVFSSSTISKIEEYEAVILKLSLILKQLPHFVFVKSNQEAESKYTKDNPTPWIFSKKGSRVLTFICPNSEVVVKKTWEQLNILRLQELCPPEKQQLRIAYNNESMPYFDLKNGMADTDTLEGAVLQLFLDKNNIEPHYMYGNYEWGSIDPDTGLWNGVVGMVSRTLYKLGKSYVI